MNILQMSISGGLLVLAITMLRALALHRLPKTMFLILWGVVLLRLLVPVSIPSQLSVYTLTDKLWQREAAIVNLPTAEAMPTLSSPETSSAGTAAAPAVVQETRPDTLPAQTKGLSLPSPVIIWLGGMLAMLIFFSLVYFSNHRRLRYALPLKNDDFLNRWLARQQLWRPLSILQSEMITTPVAVGLLKPRIILPKSMHMDDPQLLRYVLTHEYYHIRRLDTLWRLLLALSLCIHWFNPLVWLMYLLALRDLELSCDELVVRSCGEKSKDAYLYYATYQQAMAAVTY